MAKKIWGQVVMIDIQRTHGELFIRKSEAIGGFGPSGIIHVTLYDDTGVAMIDPTEMVRRNWIIGLLERALIHGLTVSLNVHDSGLLEGALITTAHEQEVPSQETTAYVTRLELLPNNGTVWLRVKAPILPPSGGPGGIVAPGESSKPTIDLAYTIYSTDEEAWPDGLLESAHKDRVIRLLQQALADHLQVTLKHVRNGNRSFVVGASLYPKE